MSGLDTALSALGAWLWQTTWQVGVLVVLIFAVQRLAGSVLTARARYALWFLVIVRLLLPALPQTPFSVFRLAGDPGQSRGSPVDAPFSRRAPFGGLAQASHRSRRVARRSSKSAAIRSLPEASTPVVRTVRSPASQTLSAGSWFVALWLLSVGLLGLRILVLELAFARRLRVAIPFREPAFERRLLAHARSLGLRRAPPAFVTDAVHVPAISGLFRTKILLPEFVVAQLRDSELDCILRHELAHLASWDLVVDRLVAALECVHWFNPAVWLAFRRMREDREIVRDSDVLVPADDASRMDYGRTLLRLIEVVPRKHCPPVLRMSCSKEQWKRRIQMIAFPVLPTPKTRVVAVSLAAGLGLAALTGAAQDRAQTEQADAETGRVRVTRAVQPEVWEQELAAKLSQPVELGLEVTRLDTAVAKLRELGGIDIVVDPEVDGSIEADLSFPKLPLGELLEAVCAQFEMGYCLRNRAVFVAGADLAVQLDRRFYDVRELIGDRGDDDDGLRRDRLAETIRTFVASDSWDGEHVLLRFWRGALVVQQEAHVQERVEAFLNRLLSHGSKAKQLRRSVHDARAAFCGKLAARVDAQFENLPLGELVAFVEAHGAPVVMRPDVDPSSTVSLKLHAARLGDAIALAMSSAGIEWSVRDGYLLFGVPPEMELRDYVVGDLVAAPDRDAEQVRESFAVFVRETIREELERDGAEIAFWGDRLLLRCRAQGHREIAASIAALKRTLSR